MIFFGKNIEGGDEVVQAIVRHFIPKFKYLFIFKLKKDSKPGFLPVGIAENYESSWYAITNPEIYKIGSDTIYLHIYVRDLTTEETILQKLSTNITLDKCQFQEGIYLFFEDFKTRSYHVRSGACQLRKDDQKVIYYAVRMSLIHEFIDQFLVNDMKMNKSETDKTISRIVAKANEDLTKIWEVHKKETDRLKSLAIVNQLIKQGIITDGTIKT